MLQGFEVILLIVLVKDLLSFKVTPINLDHDGVLIMRPPKAFNSFQSPDEMIHHLQDRGDFKPWSEYLFDESLPIEVKRIVSEVVLQEL